MNTFDMQWRHVIGIPRDLFLKTTVKVQPFRFFSSITFSDGLPLIHSLPFRKSKKYDTSYIYISYDGRPFLALLFLGSDFFFCKEIIFVTKYRIQSHVISGFSLYMLLFWKRTKMWNSFINRAFTANVIFKLKISQNRKWADKNSSETLLWVKNCLKLLIYV